jgi:hypothetical protein
MIRWNADKEIELFNIVSSGTDINEGLHRAAEEMGTTFFVVRNRWYHPNVKALRNESEIKQVEPSQLSEPTSTRVNVQAAVQILHEAIEDEVQQLREEIERLNGINNNLIRDYGKLQEIHESLRSEYDVIHRVIVVARDIAVKEHLGDKEQVHLKMDKNGNLESMKERYLGQEAVVV